jgi:hypothetical protein
MQESPAIPTRSGPNITHTYYGILPYIWTENPVTIFGTTFRGNHDLADLKASDAENLKKLFQIFYLRYNERISQMSYAIVQLIENNPEPQFKRLSAAQQLLAFILNKYSYRYEQSTLYLLRLGTLHVPVQQSNGPIVLESPRPSVSGGWETVPAYIGLRNIDNRFKKAISVRLDAKIYGNSDMHNFGVLTHLERLVDQQSRTSEDWPIVRLLETKPERMGNDTFLERVFRSLKWYNQSTSNTLESEEAGLVFLATAFECLLEVSLSESEMEGEAVKGARRNPGVTEHFVRSLQTLLGPVPRLPEWATQFYNARSAAIHRGRAEAHHFLAGPSKHKGQQLSIKSLADLGMMIYRICFTTVLAGHFAAEKFDLAGSFFHTQELVNRVIKVLKDTNKSPDDKLREVQRISSSIRNYGIEAITESTVYEATALLLDVFLQMAPPMDAGLKAAMEELAASAKLKGNPAVYESMSMFMRFFPRGIWPDDSLKGNERLIAIGVYKFLGWASHATILFHEQRARGN